MSVCHSFPAALRLLARSSLLLLVLWLLILLLLSLLLLLLSVWAIWPRIISSCCTCGLDERCSNTAAAEFVRATPLSREYRTAYHSIRVISVIYQYKESLTRRKRGDRRVEAVDGRVKRKQRMETARDGSTKWKRMTK